MPALCRVRGAHAATAGDVRIVPGGICIIIIILVRMKIYAFAEKSRKQPKVRRGISLFTLFSSVCTPKNRG